MSTLSPSRNQHTSGQSTGAHRWITVLGGAEFSDSDLEEIALALRRELDASTHHSGPITVVIRDGMTQHAIGLGPVVHVDIDLPDVIVSPVVDAATTPCTACYDRRRAQHSRDPRASVPAAVPIVGAGGLALNPTARYVLIRMLVKAIADANPIEGRRCRSRTQIYRPGKAQYLRGDLLGYSDCSCTAERPPAADVKGASDGR